MQIFTKIFVTNGRNGCSGENIKMLRKRRIITARVGFNVSLFPKTVFVLRDLVIKFYIKAITWAGYSEVVRRFRKVTLFKHRTVEFDCRLRPLDNGRKNPATGPLLSQVLCAVLKEFVWPDRFDSSRIYYLLLVEL